MEFSFSWNTEQNSISINDKIQLSEKELDELENGYFNQCFFCLIDIFSSI